MKRAIEIYTDASTVKEIRKYAATGWVSGFTTNPTLVKRGGASSYREFAKEALAASNGLPLSLEVVADDHESMLRQARILQSWGDNIYVKIPIMTTRGESCLPVVRTLLDEGAAVNVTAILTNRQVMDLVGQLDSQHKVIVSVFAGRIADAGIDPVPLMRQYAEWLSPYDGAALLWASPREVLNVVQAEDVGCRIITATPDVLMKIGLLGKDLEEFSRETVQMFYDDAVSAGFEIS